MPLLTCADAVRTVLDRALAADPGLVVWGESVVAHGASTAGLAEKHPERVRALPVADRGTLGAALGVALAGRRAVVELAGSERVAAGLEALSEAGAIASGGEFPVPLVVRVPYGGEAPGLDGAAVRWLTRLVGVEVVCASSPGMAAGLLRTALGRSRPVVLLEPRGEERAEVGEGAAPFAAAVLREGRQVTIAAWGEGVRAALDAAEALAAEGCSAEVIDLVALSPLDRATLGERVRATGRLVVVHPGEAAAARDVQQIGLDEAFLDLEAPLAEAPAEPELVARAARGAVTY